MIVLDMRTERARCVPVDGSSFRSNFDDLIWRCARAAQVERCARGASCARRAQLRAMRLEPRNPRAGFSPMDAGPDEVLYVP